MGKTLFQNVFVVDPQSPHHLQAKDILIEAGRIIQIAEGNTLANSEIEPIDTLDGTHISPGWVDMQVHLQDPGHEHKETLSQLSRAALKGGFTGLHCLTDTYPVTDNSQVIQSLISKAQALPNDFWFSGALTQHRAGKELAELYDMYQAGAVSFSDGVMSSLDSGILLRSLEYTSGFGGLIFVYPFDNGIIGDYSANEGPQATALGMKGMPMLSELLRIKRDLHLAEYAKSSLHFQPVTSSEGLAHIYEAKTQGVSVSAAVGIPYLVQDDSCLETFDSAYKVFPPFRNKEQVTNLREALKQGWIDALCTCHWAQGIEEKNKEFGLADFGMLGLQTAYSLVNQALIQSGIMDHSTLVELLSVNPRNLLQKSLVSIREGYVANLTVFHPEKKWSLDPKDIPSKAKNSAFLNQELTGCVEGIFIGDHFYPSDSQIT
ncbi:MAG: dihydroorotase [Bacteroidota bacterium]